MKTRDHFSLRLENLRTELINEIKAQFNLHVEKGGVFENNEDSYCIHFYNDVIQEDEVDVIESISVGDEIIINPCEFFHDPINLEDVGNVHDLMLLHFMSSMYLPKCVKCENNIYTCEPEDE